MSGRPSRPGAGTDYAVNIISARRAALQCSRCRRCRLRVTSLAFPARRDVTGCAAFAELTTLNSIAGRGQWLAEITTAAYCDAVGSERQNRKIAFLRVKPIYTLSQALLYAYW